MTAPVEVAPPLWVFHLPGKHDQSTHGRKGLRSNARIKATYERTDKETGLRTEIGDIGKETIDDDHLGWTRVDIGIWDKDDVEAGGATFHISPDGKTVFHSDTELFEEFQGQGFATRQMVHIVDKYRAAGVKRMTLTANSDVGGYAWARAGFDFDGPRARQGVADLFRRRAGRYHDKSLEDEIARVARNPRATPADFAMIGHRRGAKTWPGKEIMLDSLWDGVMQL